MDVGKQAFPEQAPSGLAFVPQKGEADEETDPPGGPGEGKN